MLNEEQKGKPKKQDRRSVACLRSAYFRTASPNVLKHWDMLQDRMRAAARTTTSPEEWVTEIARRWQLGAQLDCSTALRALADEVRERGASREWLDMVEAGTGI